ncbi:metabolite traffic protein EboE [Shewanella surugensis]|uniref:Metabolite traffic protein EboE n=1 Tax=Shewanella surugensis TaxID=212020 RepID=A0ABT0LHF7_9GAMM|nr:metabolite traffic protein EboE [Shewanella surugensis]MCL1126900.1 metabolite traffic protein EboE [Shewanella surugensis]
MAFLADEISYCSNVHSGGSLAQLRFNITHSIQAVRQQRKLSKMSVGLWISAVAANELNNEQALMSFKQLLDKTGLSLRSINGFPYGDFHQDAVKEKAYLPDWSTRERVQYSQVLAVILAACLPDDCDTGTISTLPLGYKKDWTPQKHQAAIDHLTELMAYLGQLYEQTGKKIILCLEMEPDCVLESTDELIIFFRQDLPQTAVFHRHLAICYDVCHQAVMFENAYSALVRIFDAHVHIGKIQLSNALEVLFNNEDTSLMDCLRLFCDSRYLHQVKCQRVDDHVEGRVDERHLTSYSDLVHALKKPINGKGRIHFHVPIHAPYLMHPQLTTTQSDILSVFDFLCDHPDMHPFLEVETYSWQVLPVDIRPRNNDELIMQITKELSWVESELKKRGLLSP